jgi:hypothetical protein
MSDEPDIEQTTPEWHPDDELAYLRHENNRLRAENEALRAAIQCERETGTCVVVHDPERKPCTAENCKFMAALGEQR